VAHPERQEDVLFGIFTQRQPADTLDDQGHQVVAGIAVKILIIRLEAQLFLTSDKF